METNESGLTLEKIQAGFKLLKLEESEIKPQLPAAYPLNEAMENGWFKKFSLLEPGSIVSSPNSCTQIKY